MYSLSILGKCLSLVMSLSKVFDRWVQTDMGNNGAKLLGFESAEITTDVSVAGLVNVVCSACWHFEKVY